MKFFWKLYFSIMLVVMVCLDVGGYALIQSGFRTSLSREVDSVYQENELLYQSLEQDWAPFFSYDNVSSIEDSELPAYNEKMEKAIISAAGRMSIQNANGNIPLQISRQDGTVLYRDVYFDLNSSLSTSLSAKEKGYRIVQIGDRYYMQAARSIEAYNTVYYVENYREITELFLNKQSQYRTFLYLMLISFFSCALAIYFLARWLMRPIRALSRATKQLANGHYRGPVSVSSKDEIGLLAEDFNTMSAQLLRTMEDLKDAATRQEMFAGNFAHELKTPLTSMIGYADMLRSKKLTEEQMVLFADQIVHDGKRLELMSMKLMDLIVLKRHNLPLQRISSKQFFQSVYQTVLPVMRQNNITFVSKCQYAVLTIDPDLMKSVCINLLDNARKAIDGQGHISLLGRRCEGGYEILVIDDGCGMEQEELSKITEAFYMVDKSRSRKKGGAGLGLAVSAEIIRLHGGALSFVSEIGQGTCARIFLKGEGAHENA